jgi:hypothetical protein
MAENNDPNDALTHFINGHLADAVNTALECTILAYKDGRVDVKPIGTKNYTDGDSNAFPVLYSLPLHWPQGDGGTAGVKVPVKVGDKCLAIFSQQPQDEGDTENTRRYSMADGYVIPGCSYDDAHAGNNSLMLYYGEAFIEITKDGKINFNAPGGIVATTPKAQFSKEVEALGLLTYRAGMAGYGSAGGVTATINGKVVITDGSSTIGGKAFNTHFHINSGGSGNGGIVG